MKDIGNRRMAARKCRGQSLPGQGPRDGSAGAVLQRVLGLIEQAWRWWHSTPPGPRQALIRALCGCCPASALGDLLENALNCGRVRRRI